MVRVFWARKIQSSSFCLIPARVNSNNCLSNWVQHFVFWDRTNSISVKTSCRIPVPGPRRSPLAWWPRLQLRHGEVQCGVKLTSEQELLEHLPKDPINALCCCDWAIPDRGSWNSQMLEPVDETSEEVLKCMKMTKIIFSIFTVAIRYRTFSTNL